MDKLKIAIVGTSPVTFALAPHTDESWEMWGINDAHVAMRRWDRWFQLHPLGELDFGYSAVRTTQDSHLRWLRGQDKPVYVMPEDTGAVPNAESFPRDGLLAEFGPYFFTSTIAWIMAYAITCKPAAIGLWGIDMADRSEYRAQRFGCWHFCQAARDRGIDIVIPPESELSAPPPPYPDRNPAAARIRRRKKVFADTRDGFSADARQAERDMAVLYGRMAEIRDGHGDDPEARLAHLAAELEAAEAGYADAAREVVRLDAQIEEIAYQEMNWAQ